MLNMFTIISAIFGLLRRKPVEVVAEKPADKPIEPAPVRKPHCWFDDIEETLDGKAKAYAAEHNVTLDWPRSIVDLLKLLGLPAELDDRRKLAKSLGYAGDIAKDSASMNVWLIEQVLAHLREFGEFKAPDGMKR